MKRCPSQLAPGPNVQILRMVIMQMDRLHTPSICISQAVLVEHHMMGKPHCLPYLSARPSMPGPESRKSATLAMSLRREPMGERID